MSLRDFTVIYDDFEYRVSRALDAQDAASMACDRVYNESAGEAFDAGGRPTRLVVRGDAGDETSWNVTMEFAPTFFAHSVP